MRKQLGFTLIELVLVIVILGILAAFAIPRFVGLGSDARAATVLALAGSLRSASVLASSVSRVDAALKGSTPDSSIAVGGETILMNNSYPIQGAGGINLMLANLTGFDPPVDGVFTAVGAATPINCQVTYVDASFQVEPTITAVTDGC